MGERIYIAGDLMSATRTDLEGADRIKSAAEEILALATNGNMHIKPILIAESVINNAAVNEPEAWLGRGDDSYKEAVALGIEVEPTDTAYALFISPESEQRISNEGLSWIISGLQNERVKKVFYLDRWTTLPGEVPKGFWGIGKVPDGIQVIKEVSRIPELME